MVEKYILDLGSSTLKLYQFDGKSLRLKDQKSVHFKDHLKDGKLGQPAIDELLQFVQSTNLPCQDLSIYATSLFRKLTETQRNKIIEQVYSASGHLIQTIDQVTENIFLELALIRNLPLKDKFLAVNVGGGSTELVVFDNGKKMQAINVDVGVADVLNKYRGINDSVSKVSLDTIVAEIRKNYLTIKLPPLKYAFLTGGELKYMQLASYPLRNNDIFKDENHPSLIDTEPYSQRNEQVFSQVTLAELESLMPTNPKWMHGARAYGAIAQAICQECKVETIIPSDVNIAHGIAHYLWGY